MRTIRPGATAATATCSHCSAVSVLQNSGHLRLCPAHMFEHRWELVRPTDYIGYGCPHCDSDFADLWFSWSLTINDVQWTNSPEGFSRYSIDWDITDYRNDGYSLEFTIDSGYIQDDIETEITGQILRSDPDNYPFLDPDGNPIRPNQPDWRSLTQHYWDGADLDFEISDASCSGCEDGMDVWLGG